MNFDDLQEAREYSGWRAYQQSKLANLLFTFELARRLEGTGVTVNTLHPGFVRTNFFQEWGGWTGWVVRRSAALIALSPEQGARTSIYLATSPDVTDVTGRYFVKEKPARPASQALDQAAAKRLTASQRGNGRHIELRGT